MAHIIVDIRFICAIAVCGILALVAGILILIGHIEELKKGNKKK